MLLLSEETVAAPRHVAACLSLEPGAAVVCLRTLSAADGLPVSLATHHFEHARFGAIGAAFERRHSITRALADLGVHDYVRTFTEVSGRMATAEEARLLALGANPIVLDTEAVNADSEGRPIQHSRTLFVAERITLRLETGAG
jgi:GntR family phosphonate transport system transcriptional regulator